MKSPLKILVYFCLCLPAWARVVQQTHPNFVIDTDRLQGNEIQAFVDVIEGNVLQQKYPVFFDLDAQRLSERENVRLVVSKLAYVVDRPVGFFSDRQLSDPAWLAHLHPGDSFTRIDEHTLLARNGPDRYRLNVYYDSDDISNLQRTRLIHAVTLTKRIDPLAGGSFATSVLFASQSSTARQGEITISNYVSISTQKTVVITYQITALARWKDKGQVEKVRGDFIKEIPALVQRTNSYKAD